MSRSAAADAVDDGLRKAIGRRLISDVPLGAFLSGGIDSSLVVAIMQQLGSEPVKTFTIGFSENGFDEARYARPIAEYLGTDHTEQVLRPSEALRIIPELPQAFSEPFADPSQLPTLLVARLARKRVSVVLTGDGGDEFFLGYSRYIWFERWWRYWGRLPYKLKRLVYSFVRVAPPSFLAHLANWIRSSRSNNPAEEVKARLLRVLATTRLNEAYLQTLDLGVCQGKAPPSPIDDLNVETELMNWMGLADIYEYLPENIMVKVDRACMRVSLEPRAPLLDPELFKLACSLPIVHKYSRGVGKLILRDVLTRYVPQKLWDRPKMGFGIPLREWLTGSLKDWCWDLLSKEALGHGYIDMDWAQTEFDEFKEGGGSPRRLWAILMFQSWFRSVSVR